MREGLFDRGEVGIPCPKCRQTTKKTIAWIKENAEFPCPNCGTIIALDREKFFPGIDAAKKAEAEFRQSLYKLRQSLPKRR